MDKRELLKLARELKTEMASRRDMVKGTLKDISLLIQCYNCNDYVSRTEIYEKLYKTRLYNKHGGEYCEYLQILAWR